MQTIDRRLIKACQNGDALTVEKILRRGANPNAQERWWPKSTALLIAVQHGHIPIINLLIQHGADPTTTDLQGRSALHYAVENQKHDIARYLITELNFDPNTQDDEGITPFLIATQNGDIKMLQLLIQLGAHPNIPNHQGQTHTPQPKRNPLKKLKPSTITL